MTEQERVPVIVTHRFDHRSLSGVNIFFFLLAGLCFLFNSFTAYGSGGDITWQSGDAKAGKQESTAVVKDASGNVIITGYQNISGDNNDDYYTVKFNGDGSGVIWAVPYDKAGGSDVATAIAVDSDGNIIVTGHASNGQNSDIHTIKYSGVDGAVLWQHTYNGPSNGNDYGVSVAVDSLNNIYVGGYTATAGNGDDFIIIKYDSIYPEYPAVSVIPVWTEVFGATGPDRATSIAAGIDGIAVTGYSYNGSNFDFLTRKYSFDKTRIWEKVYAGTSGDDRGLFVKMDVAGNVIVTGYSENSTNRDIYTVKYDGGPSGDIHSFIWEKRYDGGDADEPTGLFVAFSGDVYVTGFTKSGRYGFYTAKYNAGGTDGWSKTFFSGGDSDDIPAGIVADDSGDIFVTGHTYKTPEANRDFRTIKYKEEDGVELWNFGFDGLAHKDERPVGVVLSPTGEPMVAGWSDQWTAGASDYDYYVIKYDPGLLNAPSGLTATAITNTQVSLSWADNSDNEVSFDIWRKLGETGPYEKVGSVLANVTGYSDTTGLVADNYYFYKVRAVNGVNGNSHFSNEAHVLTRVVSYDAAAWSFIYNNSPDNGDDITKAIAVGPDDNPVVTGYSFSDMGTFDYYTVKLDRADATVLWDERYDDPDSEQDDANCVTVDNENSAIVSGFSSLYGGGAGNTNDIYTIKYPSGGSPEIWHDQYNGPAGGDDRATAVSAKTDGSGNVAVVGYGHNAADNDDIYVLKYAKTPSLDEFGNAIPMWAAKPYDGGGDDYSTAVAFDSVGNVYVTGYSFNGLNYDFFTAKYPADYDNNIEGQLPLWTAAPHTRVGNGNDQAKSLAVDSSGDVYVTGYAVNDSGNEDFYTIKYNGATGAIIWEKPYDGPEHGNDEAVSVRIDSIDGAVIVAGTSLNSAGNNDFHIIRYRAEDGSVIWERNFERHDNDDYVSDMEVDASGYIYVAGITNNGTNMDILSVIYDYEGNYLDAVLFDGGSDDYASSLTVNYQGEAFIAGYSRNASGNSDYVVLKQKHDFILSPAPLTLTPQADYSKINLAWRDNTPGTSFRIERTVAPSTPSSTWTPIYTAPSGTTSYQDTGLNYGSGYCYRIDAFLGSLSSRKSEVCISTTLHTTTLNTPEVVSTTQINLSWTNVAGNTGYNIERKTGTGSWADLFTTSADVLTYSDIGLTPGTVYTYRVSALNGSGASLPSTEQPTITLPSAPVLNAPSNVQSHQMDLTWSAVTGAASYTAEYKLSGETYSTGCTASSGGTGCTVSGLTANRQYLFRLKASNASGDSSWSNEVSAFSLLSSPQLSGVAPVSSTGVDLIWTDTSEETGYSVQESYCYYNSNWPTYYSPDYCRTYSYAWTTFGEVGTTASDVTNFSRTGLASGVYYKYRIVATVSGNYSAPSAEVMVWSGLTAPVVTVSPASETSLLLSWPDILGESYYSVERKQGAGGQWSVINPNLGINTASYTDSNLALQTEYCYRLKAISEASGVPSVISEVYSNEVCLSTPLPSPVLNSPAVVSTSQINLSWTNVTGNTGYDIQMGVTSYPNNPEYDNPGTDSYWGAWTTVGSVPADTTANPVTGLNPGYGYRFRVRDTYLGGVSAWSNVVTARTIPSAPVLSTPVGTSTSQIRVSWGDVYGETSYKLDWMIRPETGCPVDGSGTWNTITSVGQNGNLYTAGSLSAGTYYCFRMRASNGSGDSAYSNIVSQTTLLPSPTLSALSGVTTSSLELNWGNVTGNTGYSIERKTGSSGSWAQIGTTGQDVITYSATGLAPGALYYFRVRTNNNGGYSDPPSNEQSATTTPSAPVVTLQVVSASQIQLSWAVVYGATNYKIESRIGQDGPWIPLNNIALDYKELYCGNPYPQVGCTTLSPITTTYDDTGLTDNAEFCYRIKAWNSTGGDSASSNVPCMTTSYLATPTLTGSPINSLVIQLDWVYDPSTCGLFRPCRSDIDGVELEVKLSDGTWTSIFSSNPTDTSYVDHMGINPGSQYVYRARAYKGESKSGYSNEASVTTPPFTTGDSTCY